MPRFDWCNMKWRVPYLFVSGKHGLQERWRWSSSLKPVMARASYDAHLLDPSSAVLRFLATSACKCICTLSTCFGPCFAQSLIPASLRQAIDFLGVMRAGARGSYKPGVRCSREELTLDGIQGASCSRILLVFRLQVPWGQPGPLSHCCYPRFA